MLRDRLLQCWYVQCMMLLLCDKKYMFTRIYFHVHTVFKMGICIQSNGHVTVADLSLLMCQHHVDKDL